MGRSCSGSIIALRSAIPAFHPTDEDLSVRTPALVSAPFLKIVLQRQLADLGMEGLEIHSRRCGSAFASPRKTPTAPSRNWLFHCVIWLVCTSNCSDNSESVFSPLMAAKATLALKPAVWFLRGRSAHLFSSSRHFRLRMNKNLHLTPLSEFAEPALYESNITTQVGQIRWSKWATPE